MENGHQCLGYAEVGEIKRERKDSDAMANGQNNGYEYQDGIGNEMRSQQQTQGLRSHVQNASDRRRSEPMSYSDMELKGGRAATMTGNIGDYRDTTGFSDEGPTPLGKSC